jgi:hypothetical protein
MELNVGLDVPVNNMEYWKRIQEKAEDVNSAGAYNLEDE